MRHWQLLTSLVVLGGALGLGFALMGGAADADEAGEIEWLTDLDKARDQARKEGKPLLIVFR